MCASATLTTLESMAPIIAPSRTEMVISHLFEYARRTAGAERTPSVAMLPVTGRRVSLSHKGTGVKERGERGDHSPGHRRPRTLTQHVVVIFQENVSFHHIATDPNAVNPPVERPFHGRTDRPAVKWALRRAHDGEAEQRPAVSPSALGRDHLRHGPAA